jgi:hypothetical protein
MPILGSFVATLDCSLLSFFAFSYQPLTSTMGMHEETTFCFGSHGFVYYSMDCINIGSPEAVYRVVAVHMIFYLLSSYRGDKGNCTLTW